MAIYHLLWKTGLLVRLARICFGTLIKRPGSRAAGRSSRKSMRCVFHTTKRHSTCATPPFSGMFTPRGYTDGPFLTCRVCRMGETEGGSTSLGISSSGTSASFAQTQGGLFGHDSSGALKIAMSLSAFGRVYRVISVKFLRESVGRCLCHELLC